MTRPQPARVFLDSTVLYAAAIGGGCVKLWTLDTIMLVTSEYAARETWDCLRHEPDPGAARDKLSELLSAIEVIPHVDGQILFSSWSLKDPADIPILVGAIESNCNYLLTSDKKCFGEYFGRALDGVMVLQPGVFMQARGL
jgi:predicted nucleic acid-binding protein